MFYGVNSCVKWFFVECVVMSENAARVLKLVRDRGHLGGVTLAGYVEKYGGMMTQYRQLGAYAVVVILDGGGVYEDERGYRAILGKGDVILIEPDVGHRYGPEEGGLWEEFYAVFEGVVFDQWRDSGNLRSGLWKDRGEGLVEWGLKLAGGVESHAGEPLVMLGFIQLMLGELGKFDSERGLQGEVSDWVVLAMKLLGRSDLDLKEVAREVGVGYEHFRKEFKKRVGKSPSQFRQLQVAIRAWHMLAGSERTAREVAHELGFCDEYYFSRFFKKQIGMNPGDVRRSREARIGE